MQRIADLRAATYRRVQKRERETEVAVEVPPKEYQYWFLVLFSWAGYLLEFASMFVQLALVVSLSGRTSSGSLGEVMVIYYSFFLVVPATLVAMIRAAIIIAQFDARWSKLARLVFHCTAALLPFAAYALISGWRFPDLWTPAPERLSWRVQTPS